MNQFAEAMKYKQLLEYQVALSNSHRELQFTNSKQMIEVSNKYSIILGEFINLLESPVSKARGIEIQSKLSTLTATYKPKRTNAKNLREYKGGWIYHDRTYSEKKLMAEKTFDEIDEFVIDALRDFRNARGIK